MPADTKHLRLMHRQWQFRRRLPAKLARDTGKSWLIIGLHTDSLAEAQRLRDNFSARSWGGQYCLLSSDCGAGWLYRSRAH